MVEFPLLKGGEIVNKKKAVLIFIVCYIAYMTTYIARQSLSVAAAPLKELLIMDAAQIGTLGSIFSVVYSCGRLINGRLGDKIHPSVMIALGLSLIAASNLGFSFFPPFALCAVLWAVNAYGQSMLWGSMLGVMSHTFPKEKLSKVMALYGTVVSFGAVAGVFVATGAINGFGVNAAFIAPCIFAVAIGTAAFFTVRGVAVEKPDGAKVQSLPVKKLVTDARLYTALAPAFIHGVIKENVNLWMSVYFVDRFCIDLGKSALFVLFIPAFALIGRFIYPLLHRLFGGDERKVNVFAFACIVVCTVPVIAIRTQENAPWWIPAVAALSLGLISAAINVINHSMLTMLPLKFAAENSSSSSSGIMDFATYLGAGAGSLAYGYLLKFFDYSYMFASWTAISVLAAVLITVRVIKVRREKE